MAEKVISYRINIEQSNDSKQKLSGLQTEFDKTRVALRSLNQAEKKGNITTQNASKVRAKLTTKLHAQRNALNDHRAAILKNNSALRKNSGFVNGVAKGMKSFAVNMLGPIALIGALTKGISSAFNVVKNFEQGQADLASVLGVSVDSMKGLTDQARELGATTKFTASEVSGLQKEYAKLGFTQQAIDRMTESTLQLAGATNTELGRSAEVVGQTLRAFNLGAGQTQKVVDIMAKSFSSSSLDMEKFATAMSNVAPVAKNAGLSLERTTSLLGALTDKGIDASTAGTGLRNVFLELTKKGLTFEEAMGMINNAADKNAVALKLFGKRGAVVGTILAETGDEALILEGKLNDAGGAAKEMADKQLNTLNGQLSLLKSAWEGMILDMEDGIGVFSGMKDVVGFLAKNLKTIFKVIVLATSAIVIYKTAMLAGKVATMAYSAVTKGFAIVQALFTGGTVAATTAMKVFNTVVKLNPIGLLITVIGAAVTAYALFSKSVDHAAERQGILNDAIKEGKDLAAEKVTLINEDVARELKKINNDLRVSKLSKEEASKLSQEAITEEIKRTRKLIESKKDEITVEADLVKIKMNKVKVDADILNRRIREGSGGRNPTKIFIKDKLATANDEFVRKRGILQGQVLALEDVQKELRAKRKEFEIQEKEDEIIVEERKIENAKSSGEKVKRNLSALLMQLQDLKDQAITDDEAREKQQIKTKYDREIKAIKGNTEIESNLRKALEVRKQVEITNITVKFQKERDAKRLEEQKKNNSEALNIDLDYLKDGTAQAKRELELRTGDKAATNADFINLEIARLQQEIELNRIYGAETTDLERQLLEEKHKLRLDFNEKERSQKAEDKQKEAEEKQLLLNAEMASIDMISQFITANLNARRLELDRNLTIDLERVNKKSDTELQILKNQLDKGIISESQFNLKKTALDKKTINEEIVLKKKSFEEKKKLDLAAVDLELGKQLASIAAQAAANPMNAVTFGAAGIAQVAILTAQALASWGINRGIIQNTKFAKGGLLQGNSHAQGGIQTPFGEMEGGEAVINKKSTAKYGSLLSAINEAGGGVSFKDSGMFAGLNKFAGGGVLGRPTPSAANVGGSNNFSNLVAEMFETFDSAIRKIKVVNNPIDTANVLTDINQVENSVNLG